MRQDQRLALVTQTLLMAVSLHTLTSLVLIDLGLPLFLKGSHIKEFTFQPTFRIGPEQSGLGLSVIQ